MEELICYTPYAIIILPKLSFDDTGNLKEFACIGMAIEPMLKVHTKKSSEFKIKDLEGENFMELLNSLKNYFNLEAVEIEINELDKINSINYISAIVLACSISYLWINKIRNIYETINLIDELLFKNKLYLGISHILFNGGMNLYSKNETSILFHRLPFINMNWNLIVLEKGTYDFFDIIKDKNYRNVLAHHTNESFSIIQNDFTLSKIYEENKRIAFDAGLIDSDLYEIINLLNKAGFYAGYNYFSRGIHVLTETSRKEEAIKIIESIFEKGYVRIYNINHSGLFL